MGGGGRRVGDPLLVLLVSVMVLVAARGEQMRQYG
jgi:hypothetical protein